MGRMLNPEAPRPAPAKSPLKKVALPPYQTAPAPFTGLTVQPGDSEQNNPLRKFAFYACLGFILTRFGIVPEILFFVFHANTYILYLVAPPAILGVLLTGGLGRTFRHRSAWLWLGLFLWMVAATPFSSWRGDSVNRVMDYARFSFPMLLVLGGLATNWKEIRAIFWTIALALIIDCVAVRVYGGVSDDGRLSLGDSTSTIGNSNDLASHFILLLPFALYIFMDRKTNIAFRFLMLGSMGYGLSVIFGTASRGGLIAMAAMFVFALFRASISQRIVAVGVVALLAIVVPLLLPGQTMQRLSSLFGGQHEEATESKDSRAYLFRQSLIYTMQFPVFGVGPDQFANYEGGHSKVIGDHGNFHATHCAFTQISSECGVPALLFFLGGIGTSFGLVSGVYRRARREGFRDIANACFCFLLAMTGFVVSINFLANAYRFYLSAMIGLAIAMTFAARRHMSLVAADGVAADGVAAGVSSNQPFAPLRTV